MHRHPLSRDYCEESLEHRDCSRREPRSYRGNLDDGSSFREMDSGYRSIQSELYGIRQTTNYIDDIDSELPPTQSGHHSKRRGSHYMDNVSSYYHSTDSDRHGKQGLNPSTHFIYSKHHTPHSQNPSKQSTHPSTHNKHPDKRSIHHHIIKDEPKTNPKPKHQKSSGKEQLRERLYQEALQPFSKHTGTRYPCSQTDLNFHHHNVFPTRNKGPFVTCREATKELMWHNDPKRSIPAAEKAAIKNLLTLISAARDGYPPGPDAAIKAFADLDTVFFRGALRHNVTVTWHPTVSYKSSNGTPKRAWGICVCPRPNERGQCRIQLNARMVFKEGWTKATPNPFESMMGTLLHEMCHAYESVRSPGDQEPGDGHGKMFGTRIAVVHKRAVRMLGLWAIENGERHKQHHFFMPGCMDGYVDGGGEYGDREYSGGSGKRAGKGDESKTGSSGKRNDERKMDGGKKDGGKGEAGGSSVRDKRRHKGTECMLM